ncbi:MAG: hypothetical protein RIS41_1399 [Actinomycetota bacterium]
MGLTLAPSPLSAEPIDVEWLTTTSVGIDDSQGRSLAVQPDGKIVVAGYAILSGTTRHFMIARYEADGTLDPTFGTGGVSIPTFDGAERTINDIAIDSVGRIVVVGFHYVFPNRYASIARFRSDGSLDPNFNSAGPTPGLLTLDLTGDEEIFQSVALHPDDRIVAAGYTYVANDANAVLVRLTANGLPDTTFDTDGIVVQPLANGNDFVRSIEIDANGRYVLAGYAQQGAASDMSISRYTTAGALDLSFGVQGRAIIAVGSDTSSTGDVVVRPDGSILVAGMTNFPLPNKIVLVRLLNDGSLDPAFGANGLSVSQLGYAHHLVGSAALTADGRIVVIGSAQQPNLSYGLLLTRFTASGDLDTSFGDGGHVLRQLGPDADFFFDGAVLPDGSVVASGYSYEGTKYDVVVARFRPRPTVVPVYRATLDPAGGTCIDESSRSTPWTSVFVGYRYLPNDTDCTRPGHVFTGWSDTATGEPAELPLLTDPSDGQKRSFVASNLDLTATWQPLPGAIPEFVVFANFLCRTCTTAWLIHRPAEHATAYEYALNAATTTCNQSGEVFGLRVCELISLPTSTPLTVTATPRNEHGTGPTSTRSLTLNG